MRLLFEIIRWSIEELNGAIAWLRHNRKIDASGSPLKVNVGSSIMAADGWANIEGSVHALVAGGPVPLMRLLYRKSSFRNWCTEDTYVRQLSTKYFIHHNIEYGLPFRDGSVDFIYSSHTLEHLTRAVAERTAVEMHRVLKTGGRCRICVPDLAYAVSMYESGRKEEALAYFFSEKRQPEAQHHYMYDFELLEALLLKAGFSSVERCSYREGRVPDIDQLDNRPEETLYVEASKTAFSSLGGRS